MSNSKMSGGVKALIIIIAALFFVIIVGLLAILLIFGMQNRVEKTVYEDTVVADIQIRDADITQATEEGNLILGNEEIAYIEEGYNKESGYYLMFSLNEEGKFALQGAQNILSGCGININGEQIYYATDINEVSDESAILIKKLKKRNLKEFAESIQTAPSVARDEVVNLIKGAYESYLKVKNDRKVKQNSIKSELTTVSELFASYGIGNIEDVEKIREWPLEKVESIYNFYNTDIKSSIDALNASYETAMKETKKKVTKKTSENTVNATTDYGDTETPSSSGSALPSIPYFE